MLALWLVKDTGGFLKTVTAHDYEFTHWAAQVLARAMPEKAAELIFGPARGELHEYFVSDAAMELAKRHPELFLEMNPDGGIDLTPHTSPGAWQTAIINLAKTDAVAAANAGLKSKFENYPSEFANAILEVARAWKPGDPSMAGWVKGIADPKLRTIANHARLCALAEKDPHAAVAELHSAKLEVDNDLRYDAPREILAQLARADLVEALKLVKTTEILLSKYKWGPFAESSPEEEAEKAANPFYQLGPRDLGESELTNNGVRDAACSGRTPFQIPPRVTRPSSISTPNGSMTLHQNSGRHWTRPAAPAECPSAAPNRRPILTTRSDETRFHPACATACLRAGGSPRLARRIASREDHRVR